MAIAQLEIYRLASDIRTVFKGDRLIEHLEAASLRHRSLVTYETQRD